MTLQVAKTTVRDQGLDRQSRPFVGFPGDRLETLFRPLAQCATSHAIEVGDPSNVCLTIPEQLLLKPYNGNESACALFFDPRVDPDLSLIHISEPTRPAPLSRMPSSA